MSTIAQKMAARGVAGVDVSAVTRTAPASQTPSTPTRVGEEVRARRVAGQ